MFASSLPDLAALYQVMMGSDGATDLSPHSAETDAVSPHGKDGQLHPGYGISHCVDIDKKVAARFP